MTRDAMRQSLGGPGQAEPTGRLIETEQAEPASAIDILNIVLHSVHA